MEIRVSVCVHLKREPLNSIFMERKYVSSKSYREKDIFYAQHMFSLRFLVLRQTNRANAPVLLHYSYIS
jgi:hypothetical protein